MMNLFWLIGLAVFVLFVLLLIVNTIYIVPQAHAYIVQRWGLIWKPGG